MRIAIVVDGLESTRQFHSDDGDAIGIACRQVLAGDAHLEVEVFRDAQVEHLLDGLADSDIAAVFFASNSLRHPGGRVAQAVSRHRDDITNFLRAGRGLAVLHQFGDTLPPIELPNGVVLRLTPVGKGSVTATAASARVLEDDPILSYPVNIDDCQSELSREGQIGDKVSWMALDPDRQQGIEPVIVAANGDVLLGRSSDAFRWRVVVCALPLDWHRASNLLVNVAQFVTTGSPECIVWPSPSGAEPSPLAPALSQLGSSHVVGSTRAGGPRQDWLLSRPVLHLVNLGPGPEKIPDFFVTAARHGGLVLGARSMEGGEVTRFTGVIGSRRQELAQEFFADLAADPHGLRARADPFPLRNAILAAQYFYDSFPHLRNAWSPRHDLEFVGSLGALIHRDMTITSVLATMQTMAAARAPHAQLTRAHATVITLAPDDQGTRTLILACSVVLEKASLDDLLCAIGEIPDQELDAPVAIRLLDWVGFLHFTMGRQGTPGLVAEIVSRLVVNAKPCESDGIWLSVEGTASVVFGVVAGIEMCGEIVLPDPTTRGVMRLRREYAERGTDTASLGTMARVAHVLAIAERVAPLVVDRMADAVPRATSHLSRDFAATVRRDEQSQYRLLSVRNRELQARLTDARRSLSARAPIWLVGAFAAWVLALTALAVVGVLAAQMWRWPDLPPLVGAPLLAVWFWIAVRVVWRLERYEIVPKWLSRATRLFPKLARRIAPEARPPASTGEPSAGRPPPLKRAK